MPRPSSRTGGGVALICKKGVIMTIMDSSQSKSFTHFEYMDCYAKINEVKVYITVIYRPPPSKANGFRNSVFLEEWALYLERFTEIQEEILITGDFNLHLDDSSDRDVRAFCGLLDAHGLSQHVKESTHYKGHIQDLLITRDAGTLLASSPVITLPGLCGTHGKFSKDHYAVSCQINLQSPEPRQKTVTFRSLQKIDVSSFVLDVGNLCSFETLNKSADKLVLWYNYELRNLIEKHSPLQQKVITLRPHAPWYTSELRQAKHEKRRLERTWRRTKLAVHHQMYTEHCINMSILLQNVILPRFWNVLRIRSPCFG